MRQVLQSLKGGRTEVAEVPCPRVVPGHLLIRTRVSLVSVGTERMLVEFGRASILDKARQQPDKVRQVFDKVHTDGLWATLKAVRHKLDQAIPMGYCNVGTVIEVGAGVLGFRPGDRVLSNGNHAEVVHVPVNLCARVPDGVGDDEAVFGVIGAIALQGARLAQPTLGEAFVVTGLGLVGLLAVQLLRAHGCRVLGVDYDRAKLDLARRFGAEVVDLSAGEDPVAAATMFSRGRGVDGVLIAAATDSSEPVHQAAQMCRKRGRIVLVGVTGLDLSRADFYEKELSFQVSCSYGPGRYDPAYEDKGRDYPIGYVRWTEQRNFEAVLDMLAERRLDVTPLVSRRYRLEQAAEAYQALSEGDVIGVMFEYATEAERPDRDLRAVTVPLARDRAPSPSGRPVVAFIGAGNYASAVLIPAFQAAGARLKTVVSAGGVSGLRAARKYGFEHTTTSVEAALADGETNVAVIATRHDSHARLLAEALSAGKHVFVEKPLTIDADGIERVRAAHAAATARGVSPCIMVGFNRRFAPHVVRMKGLLAGVRQPRAFVMTVNAGAVPPGHWTRDPALGGGRIVGEACHFIDLLRFLAGAPIEEVRATGVGDASGGAPETDSVTIVLRFGDGSAGTIHYLANGHRSFPKEHLQVFCGGRILELDNFRALRGYGWPGFRGMHLWRQDKGNRACVAAFLSAVAHGAPAPIGFDELIEVAHASLAAAQQAKS